MRTDLWALALLLPLVLSLGCVALYRERINQQLWERELRLHGRLQLSAEVAN